MDINNLVGKRTIIKINAIVVVIINICASSAGSAEISTVITIRIKDITTINSCSFIQET